MWLALEKKLADWDAYFARRMGEKEPEEFRQADREWIEATLPQVGRRNAPSHCGFKNWKN